MRTIGKKKVEKVPKEKEEKKPWVKETQADRKLKARRLKKENPGFITSYAENHKRLTEHCSSPFKKIRTNELGIARNSTAGVYDSQRFPHIAEVLCREYGFILAQIAEVFGVARPTVEQWIQIHPEFKTAVRRGREQFDSEKVEQSLLKRALGYEYEERTVRTVMLIGKKKFQDIEVAVPAKETVTTYKSLAPDVKAIMFWLQNRQSDRWKSVAYINAQTNSNKTITHVKVDADIENMSVEQIKALRGMIEVNQGGEKQQEAIEIDNEEMGKIIHKAGQKLLGIDDEIEDYDFEEGD